MFRTARFFLQEQGNPEGFPVLVSPLFYFFPRNATQALITYSDDEITIAAICPQHTKVVNTAFILESGRVFESKVSLQIPELYITHRLREGQFSIFSKTNGLFAPYTLANVYDYGVICFGDIFSRYPKDLRQAWNYFWESPFNQENSGYVDYHQTVCQGAVTHSYAGHRESNCICACCLEICTCPCYCVQSQVFEDYLRQYKPNPNSFIKQPFHKDDSLIIDLASTKILLLPGSYASQLGLQNYKYADIFLPVISEDDKYFHTLYKQQIQIPKTWFRGSDGNFE